jgi:serine/threonine protein kinase/tetratricopeptide (TPR) repeat protein
VDTTLWKRIAELFAAARQRSGDSRIAFLKDSCGSDQDLYAQVMALLEADDSSAPDSPPTLGILAVPEVIAGRFRIIRYIADGGMGTVYEAEDLTLNDRVALKTIRPEIVSDRKTAERFKREILLGKKVTHPNVCRVYDLGVHRSESGDEFLFLTMQFLPGETLAARIKRGPMPVTEALPLIEDITDALAAAHQAEVIHRDFKSGNVILVNGRSRTSAIVTDFGLARSVRDDSSKTHIDMAGTVDYMAPEQIRGEEITPLVDIYALGVVMYEMVTGQRPFSGDSRMAVALKQLNDEPRAPRDVVPELGANWNDAILGCLRKRPHERFQSAAEVKDALLKGVAKPPKRREVRASKLMLLPALALVVLAIGAWFWFRHHRAAISASQQPGISEPVKSIAVLPLTSNFADPEQAYFADGMTQELIDSLSRITALRVISRTSVMAYKDSHKPLAEIARELNVDVVVEGTVERANGQVRISADLVDARADRSFWAHSYEGNLRDVLSLQSEVAQAIANEIRVQVLPGESAAFSKKRSVDPQSYETYLRALYLLNKRTPEALRSALREFQKAIDQDPTSALAWAGLADSYTLLGSQGEVPPREVMPMAEAAAKKALQLDNSLAQAHASLAIIDWTYEWDSDGAKEQFTRAIALNPSYATAHAWYGLYLNYTGKFADALQEMQRAQQLDPLSVNIRLNVGRCYYFSRNYDTAIEKLNQVEREEPDSWIVSTVLGRTYLVKNSLEQAIQKLDYARTLSPMASLNLGILGDAYGRAGQKKSALQVIDELEGLSHTRYVPPIYSALVYMGMGDKARAFAFLDKAYSERSEWMVELNGEPEFDPIRGDPQFQALLRRVAEARSNPEK